MTAAKSDSAKWLTIALAFLVQLAGLFYWGGNTNRLVNSHDSSLLALDKRLLNIEACNTPMLRNQASLVERNTRSQEELWKAISNIRSTISRLPQEDKWMLKKINKIEKQVERMLDMVIEMQRLTRKNTASPKKGLAVPAIPDSGK